MQTESKEKQEIDFFGEIITIDKENMTISIRSKEKFLILKDFKLENRAIEIRPHEVLISNAKIDINRCVGKISESSIETRKNIITESIQDCFETIRNGVIQTLLDTDAQTIIFQNKNGDIIFKGKTIT